jgi:thymidine phosphorylase
VTATVPSIPLIVASIMSKKLAESLDRLVLDVKFGSGAFMQNRADAETLSSALCATGRECGVQTEAILTPMDKPLGHTAGNALEVWESVETLQGRGPADLVALTLNLAERVANVPRTQLAQWLSDGTAWRKWVQLVEAQGGRAADTERILEIHAAPITHHVPAARSGKLVKMDAGLIGRACITLGAGRSKATDPIDFAVGVSRIAKLGTTVQADEPLLTVHARTEESLKAALVMIEQAIEIS